MELPRNTTPAPYGKACKACARAKCRCLFQADLDACERCNRLGRECRPGELKRSRKSGDQGKSRKASRVDEAVSKAAELERKFDRLVAELKRGGNTSAALETADLEVLGSISPNVSVTSEIGLRPTPNSLDVAPISPDQSGEASNANHQPDYVRSKTNITSGEAELRFERFKTDYLRWAPFVHFPTGITAAQLYNERPTFWLSIMLTCERSQAGIQYLDNVLREILAEEMVVKSTKSVDLLLALVTSLSWYNHHCRYENGTLRLSMTLMSHLATSLVFGLKGVHTSHPQNFLRTEICKSYSTFASSVVSMEESRAILACYLVTNSIHLVLQRSLPLRWAAYLEECLRQLQQNEECEGDQILAHQVQIQKVIEKATAFKEWGPTWETAGSIHSPPIAFYVPSLRAELERLRGTMPVSNELLSFHSRYAELIIHEFGMSKLPSNDSPLSLQQLKIRSTSLNIAKAWLTEFTNRPALELHTQTLTLGMQLSSCLSILFHLTTVPESGWGKEQIDDIDILHLIDGIVEHMARGAEMLSPGDDDTVSTQCQLYRSMRGFWASRILGGEQMTDLDMGLVEDDEEFLRGILNTGFCDNDWMMGWPGNSY